MNERLMKEARDLLPAFACMLVLIVLPYVFLPAGGFGLVVLGIACVVMAGSSFGNEFQYRTFSLLLSQPISRSAVWREKMLVLGAGMMGILATLGICLAVRGFGYDLPEAIREPGSHSQEKLALALIPLCAFCGAPFWTLLLRHEIGGMAFAAAAPLALLLGDAFVLDLLGYSSSVAFSPSGIVLLLIYCVVAYWLGYAKFRRLQVVDGPSRELSLPASLEARITRPLSRLSSRFRGPFAALLKKELHLQQVSFLLAGLFVLIALAGACLVWLNSERGGLILAGDYGIYVLVLPFIAGAMAVAEEKGWDLAEWHLTLPPSALKQWSAKMLATLSTSFVLGLVLPAVTFLVGNALLEPGPVRDSLPPAYSIPYWLLGQLLFTSVAVYAASFSTSTIKAILAAFAIIVVGGVVCRLAGVWAIDLVVNNAGMRRAMSQAGEEHLARLAAAAMASVLCLVQWLSYSNFRRFRLPGVVLLAQLAVLFLCVGMGTLLCISLEGPWARERVILLCAELGSLAVIVSAFCFRPARRGSLVDRFRVILLWVAVGTLVLVSAAYLDWFVNPVFGQQHAPLWRWIR